MSSKINAASVFFPIAIARWLGPFASAVFFCRRHWHKLRLFSAFIAGLNWNWGIGHGRHHFGSGLGVKFALMKASLDYSVDGLERLTHFSVLVIEGLHASDFIQAQSMNDVKLLQDGQWHWNGLLNPKGRLIALFALLRVNKDEIWLVSPDISAEQLRAHLQRFIFRSKVTLRVLQDWQAYACFKAPSDSTAPDFMHGDASTGIALNMSGDNHSRYLYLLPAQTQTRIEKIADTQWRDIDLKHGLPRLAHEQAEAWTPQMLSLQRLNAFSVKKGCYPGQEIVARTHFLGQSKRFLIGISDQSASLQLGQHLNVGEQEIGQVISINHSHTIGLAVVSGVDESLVKLNEALKQPLLAGLQRPV
jgi:tRNA-modifying protein YgfZ